MDTDATYREIVGGSVPRKNEVCGYDYHVLSEIKRMNDDMNTRFHDIQMDIKTILERSDRNRETFDLKIEQLRGDIEKKMDTSSEKYDDTLREIRNDVDRVKAYVNKWIGCAMLLAVILPIAVELFIHFSR